MALKGKTIRLEGCNVNMNWHKAYSAQGRECRETGNRFVIKSPITKQQQVVCVPFKTHCQSKACKHKRYPISGTWCKFWHGWSKPSVLRPMQNPAGTRYRGILFFLPWLVVREMLGRVRGMRTLRTQEQDKIPRDRAYTRAQSGRAKQRASRNLNLKWRGCDLEFTPRDIGIIAETAKPCSCDLCGNPRKHFNEITVQEKRATQWNLTH